MRGVPELVWALRHEMATMLLEVAEQEEPAVAGRLAAVAAAFDAGQSAKRR